MVIPLVLIVGLIAALTFANTKNKRGPRTLNLPPDDADPGRTDRDAGVAVTRTPAWAATSPTALRSRPVTTKLEILIGLRVSGFEKLLMSTDSMEEDLVKFTTASTRRLNRATPAWTTGGRFIHPRVTYADKDFGFRIEVAVDYTAAITQAEMVRLQNYVNTFIAENDDIRPRLLYAHVRKV